jgi:nicotinate-nucleotide adenylyltransferase
MALMTTLASHVAQPTEQPHLSFFRAAPAGVGIIPRGRQLGIFSGAFNPITLAHVALAQSASTHYQLHEVLFLLPITQPHKLIGDAPIDARLYMMALAVHDNSSFSVGSCTHGLFIDICRAVEQAYPPATQLSIIIGRDAAERILTWPYPDPEQALRELFTRAELLVADRDGTFTLPDHPMVRAYADHIHHLPLPPAYSHISATEVRRRLARGEAVAGLISPAVLAYIQAHHLYQETQEGPPK